MSCLGLLLLRLWLSLKNIFSQISLYNPTWGGQVRGQLSKKSLNQRDVLWDFEDTSLQPWYSSSAYPNVTQIYFVMFSPFPLAFCGDFLSVQPNQKTITDQRRAWDIVIFVGNHTHTAFSNGYFHICFRIESETRVAESTLGSGLSTSWPCKCRWGRWTQI